MTTPQVVVVGSGPTGLTAALVLARAGVPVRVVTAADGPVVESRALVVHARTLELWQKLGLAEAAVARGQPLREVVILRSGRPLRSRALDIVQGGRDLTPFGTALVLEQHETERLLLTALEGTGAELSWRTRLTALRQDADGVDLTLAGSDGAVETLRTPWVVGADGASSTVRHELGVSFAGSTYRQAFYLADVDLRWSYGHEQFSVNLADRSMALLFPMRGGDRFRVVGVLPEELTTRAATDGLTLDDVRHAVQTLGRLPAEIDNPRWITSYRIQLRRAGRFRVGRVFLAGDAAHVHSPAGGQGMNTGIGDAYNLAWKLAAVTAGAADPALLDSYEPERVPLADALLRNTDRMFSFQASPSAPVAWLRARLLPLIVPLANRSSHRLFRLLSQAWVSYRDSPAVVDAAPRRGPVRAGDRAPWAHLPDGTDLFDLLVGTGSHLLAFPSGTGGTPGFAATACDVGVPGADLQVHVVAPDADALRRRYGIHPGSDAVVLVRPDGHVGVRSQPADLDLVRRHLTGGPVTGAGGRRWGGSAGTVQPGDRSTAGG